MSHHQAAAARRVQAVLAPGLHEAGFDLEDVVVTVAGRRRQVRVIVDRDGGLTLDDVAAVSSTVSELLDDAGVLGETPYVLEVSSPGVDRPLREPRHWRRAVGRLVSVRVAGEGTWTARIATADEDGVELVGEDASAGTRRVPYPALGPGAVQVEFGRPEAQPVDDHGPVSAAG